jgi:PPOX class probable F420-dependent enzyme
MYAKKRNINKLKGYEQNNMNSLEQFSKKKYLNLETFRKSGVSMRTPVWFIQDGETIYIQTMANSGKVKRIRNNGLVNIAPCKMDGKLIGPCGSPRRRAWSPIPP